MGGAQPLAITMNGGVALCVEVDPHRIERRLETGYLDESYDDLEQALARAQQAKGNREAVSIGLLGNAAEVFPRLLSMGASCVRARDSSVASLRTSSPTRPRRTIRSTATYLRATPSTRPPT